MSIGRTWQIESTSLSNTLAIARGVGHRLRGGEVIELVSDLGGGKTAFVRGLAEGIGSRDAVRSPSFTLSNEYRGNQLTLYHLDFYRLGREPGIMRDELAEMLADPQGVVAVEWAASVKEVLPARRLRLQITATGENTRQLIFTCPAELDYLRELNT